MALGFIAAETVDFGTHGAYRLRAFIGGPRAACGHQRGRSEVFTTRDAAIAWIEREAREEIDLAWLTKEELDMGIFVGAKRFEAAPEGTHAAVCCDVVELGIVETKFGKKEMVKLVWIVDELNTEGKRFTLSKRYNASLDRRATLRKDLESWRGRRFTAEEETRFDLEAVLGKPCQIQVVHNPGEAGRVYANVENVIPLGKGMAAPAAPEPKEYLRQKDRQAAQGGAVPPEDQVDDQDVPF